MYGPGGVKSVTALLENYPQRDWATWLMATLLPLFGHDIEWTARGVSLLGSCLSVFGLSLCAQALAGRAASWAVGLCGAFYAPLVWTGLLVGADASGTGLVWLGLGILFAIARHSRLWIFVPLGIACIILGTKVKITAFPAAAFLAIPPLLNLSQKSLLKNASYAALLLSTLYFGLQALPDSNAHVGERPPLTWSGLEQGWTALRALFNDYDVLPQLAVAAFCAALLPGQNILARAVLFLTTLAVSAYIPSVIGAKLRPRYLIPSTLPLLLLIGSAVYLWRWPKRYQYIPAVASGAIVVLLFLDSIAFHQAWSELMHERDGSQKGTFFEAPAGWRLRYQKLSGLLHSDHSDIGIRIQHELAQNHPYDMTLGVPLRDGREFHLRAASGLAGKSYRILEAQYCCSDTNIQSCAERTLSAFKKSGGRLILPTVQTHHNRIPHQSAAFTNALIRLSKQESGWTAVEPWWGYLDAEGDGSTPPPCQRPVRDGKGKKNLRGR